MVLIPYNVEDGVLLPCEKAVAVNPRKVKVIGDVLNQDILLEDGVLFGKLDLFQISYKGHLYGSTTMTLGSYMGLVNDCCPSGPTPPTDHFTYTFPFNLS
jgi:hypothetical protein